MAAERGAEWRLSGLWIADQSADQLHHQPFNVRRPAAAAAVADDDDDDDDDDEDEAGDCVERRRRRCGPDLVPHQSSFVTSSPAAWRHQQLNNTYIDALGPMHCHCAPASDVIT